MRSRTCWQANRSRPRNLKSRAARSVAIKDKPVRGAVPFFNGLSRTGLFCEVSGIMKRPGVRGGGILIVVGVTGLCFLLLLRGPGAASEEAARKPAKEKTPITYARQVSRVIQDKCQSCHHPGTAAPFSLLTYKDAVHWSETIRDVLADKRMPPWHADPRFGTFSNDRRLSKQELDTLVGWLDSDMPMGDEKDLPP